jgi:hypothetical protein
MIDSIRNARIAVQRMCFPEEVKGLVSKHLREYLTEYMETGNYVKSYQPAFQFGN